MRRLITSILLACLAAITVATSADARTHRKHHRVQVPAHIVTAYTKMGPIRCAPSFCAKVVPLINEMHDMGLRAEPHCFQHRRGNSNHKTGHACDFHGSANKWAAMNNHRLSGLIHRHGLRDGCDFGDCGHVDDAHNIAGGIAKWRTVMANGYKPRFIYGRGRTYANNRLHRRGYRRYAQAKPVSYDPAERPVYENVR